MKRKDVSMEEYRAAMDKFREMYGHVWNAPKWARDEVRALRVNGVQDRPKQLSLFSPDDTGETQTNSCNE